MDDPQSMIFPIKQSFTTQTFNGVPSCLFQGLKVWFDKEG